MSEPRFSDKVERTQKAGLANPDKDVSLYIRSPGSSDREKFGRIVGRKLILPEESNCAGYVFTHDEWMDAVKIGKHYPFFCLWFPISIDDISRSFNRWLFIHFVE